jgi:ubiquinone/menaquinone biosynthesis C-methylase UbiE
VVEIGAGTGLVTRRLVAAGAWVVAVEPDQNMAAHLAAAVSGQVEILRATIEQAALPQGRFDLAVAATSFHWVDQAAGLPKLGQVIRPGASRRCTPAADRTEAREQRSGTHRVLPLTRTTGFTRTALLQQNTQFGVADPRSPNNVQTTQKAARARRPPTYREHAE